MVTIRLSLVFALVSLARGLVLIDPNEVLSDATMQFNQLEADTAKLITAAGAFDGTDHVTTSDPTTLRDKIDTVILDASSLSASLDAASTDGVNNTVSDLIAALGLTYYNQYNKLINVAYNNRANLMGDATRLQDMATLNTMVVGLLSDAGKVGPNSYSAAYSSAITELRDIGVEAVVYLRNQAAGTTTVTTSKARVPLSTISLVAIPTTSALKVLTSLTTSTTGVSKLKIALSPATVLSSARSTASAVRASSFVLSAVQTGSVYSSDPNTITVSPIQLNGETIQFQGSSPTFAILSNGSLSDGTNLYFTNTRTQINFHSSVPIGYDGYGNPQYGTTDHPGNSILQAEPRLYLPDFVNTQIFSLDSNGVLRLTVSNQVATFYRCYYRDGSYLYAVLPLFHTASMDSACFTVTLIAS